MNAKKYRVQFTQSGKDDMRGMKEYILRTFQYRELGQNFTKKMKKAVEKLKVFPTGYDAIDYLFFLLLMSWRQQLRFYGFCNT